MLAVEDRHCGNFHFLVGSVLASQNRRKMTDRAVLANVGDKCVQIDSRPADPAFEQLAARLFFSAELSEIQKCRVRGQNASVEVRDDEAVGQTFHHTEKLRLTLGLLLSDQRHADEKV